MRGGGRRCGLGVSTRRCPCDLGPSHWEPRLAFSRPGAGGGAAAEPKSAWVALALVTFFIPVLTMAVPPGADMAMHVALARPMIRGESILSPAWGSFEAVY